MQSDKQSIVDITGFFVHPSVKFRQQYNCALPHYKFCVMQPRNKCQKYKCLRLLNIAKYISVQSFKPQIIQIRLLSSPCSRISVLYILELQILVNENDQIKVSQEQEILRF